MTPADGIARPGDGTSARLSRRPLRWYLLVWLCLTYLSGVFGSEVPTSVARLCGPGTCPAVVAAVQTLPVPTLLGFTGLMCLLAALVWRTMSDSVADPWRGVFVIQGVLVLGISFLPGQHRFYLLVFSLYLALALEALAVFQHARPVMLIGGFYCVLLFIDFAIALYFLAGGSKLRSHGLPRELLVTLLGQAANYLALLFFAVGYLIMYVQQLRDRNELETAHRQLKSSAAQISELTLLAERQRMAREMHDTLVQDLAGLVRQLDVAVALVADQRTDRAHAIIRESSASARAALTQARGAIGNLRTAVSDSSQLPRRVRDEADRLSRTSGVECGLDLDALADTPQASAGHVLATIVEALGNVARHAQANRVQIDSVKHDDSLVITVQDDGVGFDTARTQPADHYGLIGLRERARLIRGRLEIHSTPGHGTRLVLQVPLRAENEPR